MLAITWVYSLSYCLKLIEICDKSVLHMLSMQQGNFPGKSILMLFACAISAKLYQSFYISHHNGSADCGLYLEYFFTQYVDPALGNMM